MTNHTTESDVLERIDGGLKDAVEGYGLNWKSGTKVKRQKYTDIALDYFVGPIDDADEQYPITRSWFKYGCVSPNAPSGTNSWTGPSGPSGPDGPTNEDIRDPNLDTEIKGTSQSKSNIGQHEISEQTKINFFEFFDNSDFRPRLNERYWKESDNLEFLQTYYEERAPPELQELYLANIGLRKTMQDAISLIKNISKNRVAVLTGDSEMVEQWNQQTLEEDAGRAAVDLRMALYDCAYIDDETVDAVRTFTDLLEDLLLNITQLAPTDLKTEHYRAINELDEFYDETTWEYVAFHLSRETAVGPQATECKETAARKIDALRESHPRYINKIRERFQKDSLLPELSSYTESGEGSKAEEAFMNVIDQSTRRKISEKESEEIMGGQADE